MQYFKLYNTELNLSNVCLGAGNFMSKITKETAFEIMDAFAEAGGNFIDTANVYGRDVDIHQNFSEQIIGEWLRSRGAQNTMHVATKGGHYDLAARVISRITEADIRADLDESRRSLGLDVIDFYWLHRDNIALPIEEITDIMETLRKEGKIRYYGYSNYTTARLQGAKAHTVAQGLCGPYAVSNQWSLATMNKGGRPGADPTLVAMSAEEYNWHVETQTPSIPYSSTAFGFFEKLKAAGIVVKNGQLADDSCKEAVSEKLCRIYWNAENLAMYERLLKLQQETGASLQALSIAYFHTLPFQVIPVNSVRNLDQLQGMLSASDLNLKAEDFAL